MSYIGVKEAAKNWNISDRRIRLMCQEGRIEGAIKLDWSWAIPQNTKKPTDGRHLRKTKSYGLRLGYLDLDELEKLKANCINFDISPIVLDNIDFALNFEKKKIKKKTIENVLNKNITSLSLDNHLIISNYNALLLRSRNDDEVFSSKKLINLYESFMQGIIANVKIKEESRISFETFFSQLEREWKTLHPIFKAILTYCEIIKIQLFSEYNDETASLVLSYLIYQSGFLPPYLSFDVRDEIKAASLLSLKRGNYKDLVEIIERLIIKSYKCMII